MDLEPSVLTREKLVIAGRKTAKVCQIKKKRNSIKLPDTPSQPVFDLLQIKEKRVETVEKIRVVQRRKKG